MDELKPNSNKPAQPERKKVETVVKRPARLKKKNGLADVFISEDISNVKNYVFGDILIPTIKNTIVDIITDSISMLILGESRGRKKGSRSDSISYTKYYDRGRSTRTDSINTRNGYSYTEVEVDTRDEADEVLARMDEIIDQYGMVSVLDMYDLVGVTGNYTDNKYGWTNIRNAEVIRGRDGYVIKMPKALPLK